MLPEQSQRWRDRDCRVRLNKGDITDVVLVEIGLTVYF
jgi:hypothetical protein